MNFIAEANKVSKPYFPINDSLLVDHGTMTSPLFTNLIILYIHNGDVLEHGRQNWEVGPSSVDVAASYMLTHNVTIPTKTLPTSEQTAFQSSTPNIRTLDAQHHPISRQGTRLSGFCQRRRVPKLPRHRLHKMQPLCTSSSISTYQRKTTTLNHRPTVHKVTHLMHIPNL